MHREDAEIIPVEPDAVRTAVGTHSSHVPSGTPLHYVYNIMRGLFFLAAFMTLVPFSAAAAENDEAGKTADKKEKLDSVVVSASRATSKTPVTYTMIG